MSNPKGYQNRMIRFRRVIDSFSECVRKSAWGTKGMADELDKSVTQMSEELNSSPGKTTNAKLGVDDSILIMQITENIEPLRAMAAELGCRVLRLPDAPELSSSTSQQFVGLDAAILDLKRLAASGAPYPQIIAAMAPVQDAMNLICVLKRAEDEGISPVEAAEMMPMFRRGARGEN